MNLTQGRKDEFLSKLRDLGGRSGNKALRNALGWEEDFYSKCQQKLVAEGRIRSGPGYGGTVHISEEAPEKISPSQQLHELGAPERQLYAPMRGQIEAHWIPSRGYHDFILEETHSQGSRATGGTYSRPDITVIGVRKYLFLPTILEAVTFEIKARDSISVLGILEALTHRESVHKSYSVYQVASGEFDKSDEAPRIISLAQKHGVGLILVDDPKQYDTWDIRLEAQWTNPDPDRLDAFINGLADTGKKQKLQKAIK
jgi:hypothetical protein